MIVIGHCSAAVSAFGVVHRAAVAPGPGHLSNPTECDPFPGMTGRGVLRCVHGCAVVCIIDRTRSLLRIPSRLSTWHRLGTRWEGLWPVAQSAPRSTIHTGLMDACMREIREVVGSSQTGRCLDKRRTVPYRTVRMRQQSCPRQGFPRASPCSPKLLQPGHRACSRILAGSRSRRPSQTGNWVRGLRRMRASYQVLPYRGGKQLLCDERRSSNKRWVSPSRLQPRMNWMRGNGFCHCRGCPVCNLARLGCAALPRIVRAWG